MLHGNSNIKDSKYKYTYYQNTNTIFLTPPHTITHTVFLGFWLTLKKEALLRFECSLTNYQSC